MSSDLSLTGTVLLPPLKVALQGAAVPSTSLHVSAEARSSNPTAVTNGQSARLIATLLGALVNKPFSIPELDWSFASAITGLATATDTAIQAAAGVGLRRYATSMQIQNNSSTAGEFQIKDGDSTVIWRGWLPANLGLIDIYFASPLRTTANTALNARAVTVGMVAICNFQGYTAP